jgi:hypothetical protein
MTDVVATRAMQAQVLNQMLDGLHLGLPGMQSIHMNLANPKVIGPVVQIDGWMVL